MEKKNRKGRKEETVDMKRRRSQHEESIRACMSEPTYFTSRSTQQSPVCRLLCIIMLSVSGFIQQTKMQEDRSFS